jgi:antitoxin VapB
MPTRTTLFLSNRSQAVRLPKGVAFGAGVREVVILRDGVRRVIAPADAAWDDFFTDPGVDLGERCQPAMQEREAL